MALAELRAALGWSHAPFEVPAEIVAAWDARPRGAALEAAWQKRFDAYAAAHPELGAEYLRVTSRALPSTWPAAVGALYDKARAATTRATRKASQDVLDDLVAALPELFGGSADLTWSNLTFAKGSQPIDGNAHGNYAHYGVREFGMAAAMNGVALHGGLVPYGGTFLVFSDYMRNAIRMSALMHQRVIYVLTHDSIGLGEDGPTHQPVEHAAALRVIPGVDVWRPCDPLETAAAWVAAIERTDGPSCLLLSRQNLPIPPRPDNAVEAMRRGGYVISDAPGGAPQAVVIATGSEVGLALEAQKQLAGRGIAVRVVSMPSTSVFDRQDAAWRDGVLPPGVPCASIEAGVTGPWRQYVGRDGLAIGVDRFGESAPAGALFDYFGLTADKVAARLADWLAARR
jgi:transketolase